MLGSGAVVVVVDWTCLVKVLENHALFYFGVSCGECKPGREGTGWEGRVMLRKEHGHGGEKEIDQLDEVAGKIAGRTICALGDAAAMPVQSFIKEFRD